MSISSPRDLSPVIALGLTGGSGRRRAARPGLGVVTNKKEDRMITVMGATGHTGKKITEGLLKGGDKVRALERDLIR
jgi:NmrA-like family